LLEEVPAIIRGFNTHLKIAKLAKDAFETFGTENSAYLLTELNQQPAHKPRK
jgi:hypothetical protein